MREALRDIDRLLYHKSNIYLGNLYQKLACSSATDRAIYQGYRNECLTIEQKIRNQPGFSGQNYIINSQKRR